jgi:hypothetical protein
MGGRQRLASQLPDPRTLREPLRLGRSARFVAYIPARAGDVQFSAHYFDRLLILKRLYAQSRIERYRLTY